MLSRLIAGDICNFHADKAPAKSGGTTADRSGLHPLKKVGGSLFLFC
jgi:hypothetical protein